MDNSAPSAPHERLGDLEYIIIALLSKALFGIYAERLPTCLTEQQTAQLYIETRRQAVPAIALDGFDNPTDVMGEKLYKGWLATSRAVLASTERIFRNHAFVAGLLEKHGIPYAMLKGCASASCYPKPYLRVMGDVDFLVAQKDVATVETLLTEQGYSLFEMDKHLCHIVYRRGEHDSLELHFNPPGIPYGTKAEAAVRAITDTILTTAKPARLDDFTFYMPDDLHQFFVLLLHTQHHMIHSGIGLRHLCDLAVFYAARVTEPFWEKELAPKLRECGLYVFACTVLGCAHKYLGMPCNGVTFEADDALCEAILLDIFAGGNFGRKNEKRSQAHFLTSDGVSSTTGRSFIMQALVTLKNISQSRYPVTKRVPVLMIFTVPYTLLRYLWRGLTGKRLLIGSETIAYARQRKTLYDRLHMFEPEK